jgi:hypothetical protein
VANSSITLVDLDFDSFKDSLKQYLKAQPQFTDYDFEGSNINVLLDILSYNTFHNAFYMNMVLTESYLDSAQLRNSVVSQAKELNYLPRSARSAKASVDLEFTANTNVVTIPKGTSFTTTVGSNLLTFITDDESVHFSSNGTFSVSNLSIYEGRESSERYVVNYNNPTQRFLIMDPKVDTRSVSVTVIEDDSGSIETYLITTTTLDLTELSKVFFLQAAEDGKYEVIFGDGILGRRPKDNAVVQIDYRICSSDGGNGASRFFLDTAFTEFTSTPTVETVSIGQGGAEPETLNSIKFYAPRYFQTQERAINVSDYEILLKQRFPEINILSAYGGEDVDPPQFGKVFISVDISDVDGLPESKITEYSEFLKPRSPLSISAVFIEPDFLYYKVITNVKYNLNDTDLNSEQVKSLVANRIITYHSTNLNDFKASFKYSRFLGMIDDTEDAAILSNDTDVLVYKRFEPDIGENVDVDVDFNIPLTEAGAVLDVQYGEDDLTAVYSSTFTFNSEVVRIDDDGDGTLRLVKVQGSSVVVVIPSIGTIDYATGSLKLINFRVDGLPLGEQYIRVYARTASKDFETTENIILDLEPDQMEIEVTAVRETETD